MAPYPPGYQPVSFRFDLADAAAQACTNTAAALHEATADRQRRAVVAQAEWRGSFRDAFDRDLTDLSRAARHLEDRLRHLAGAIEAAADAAAQENQRRTGLRADWDRQHSEAPAVSRTRVA